MKEIIIGEPDFSKIIQGGFLYVDKTRWLYPLVKAGGYYFLSRPRRFGKSLLTTTLKYIFQGRKDLFEGLWIYDKHDWTKTNPVILLSFTTIAYREEGLQTALCNALDWVAAGYKVQLESSSAQEKFRELILKLSEQAPVAILIDEYDKSLLDYLDDLPQAAQNRDLLRGFYGILKDQTLSPRLRLVLLTGVSKFARVSIFSELNNLEDLSVSPNFSIALGITQQELEENFAPYISQLAEKENMTQEALLEKMKDWYNGYSWEGKNFVYNPFSLLNLFKNLQFDNYWFTSGTPTFLVKSLKNRQEPLESLEKLEVNQLFFQSFDFDNLDVYAIMFQAGYLTVKQVTRFGDQDMYTLGFPNSEVRNAFYYHLLEAYAEKGRGRLGDMVYKIQKALYDKDVDTFITQLKVMFSDISYHLHPPGKKGATKAFARWEGYFHSLTYLLLKLVGIIVHVEMSKSHGRMDALVEAPKVVYVIEFKMGSAQEAMDQIKASQYAASSLGKDKPVVMLGIGFDLRTKNVKDWKMEEIGA